MPPVRQWKRYQNRVISEGLKAFEISTAHCTVTEAYRMLVGSMAPDVWLRSIPDLASPPSVATFEYGDARVLRRTSRERHRRANFDALLPAPTCPVTSSIGQMFDRLAPKYDLANDFLSVGLHRRWRRRAIRASRVAAGDKVLDAATGTGGLALGFAERVDPGGEVVGVDISSEMLEEARTKAARAETPRNSIEWRQSDVRELAFPDDYFDIASIGFGIRNVDEPMVGLEEMRRTVRPGGRIVVLEFGRPEGLLRPLYEWYSRNVLPLVGGAVTGHPEAYRYLHRSSGRFPWGDEFVDRLEEIGLIACRDQPLAAGIAHLYLAEVPDGRN